MGGTTYTTAQLQADAAADATEYGVPVSLFLNQIGQESSWNPDATNGNASGIAQFEPATAASYGLNTSDPVASLSTAAEYDATLYNQTGSWESALQAYGTTANGDATALNAQAASIDAGTTSGASGTVSSAASSTSSSGLFSSITGFITEIENSTFDIIAVVLGVVLIGGALFMFAMNSKPAQVVTRTAEGVV